MTLLRYIIFTVFALTVIGACASPGILPEEPSSPAVTTPPASPPPASLSAPYRASPYGRPSLPQPGPVYPEYRPLPPPLTIPPRADRNRGAFNPFTGEFYPPSGRGVINPWTGEYYPPAGHGYFNPRTGQLYPSR
ncbi:MAG: hypothetical protein PHG91_02570 [Syntrophales bacterium]|nr:hypothetical protein [Syntrophales bacterium]MDD5531766.1 hypothetical protein [Syntrophales bacterium]HPL64496.1 hypothetical protein [Syntrophales bacterium]